MLYSSNLSIGTHFRKGIHVVIPHWLWSCAERWERVDERVFELNKETEIQLDDVRYRF